MAQYVIIMAKAPLRDGLCRMHLEYKSSDPRYASNTSERDTLLSGYSRPVFIHDVGEAPWILKASPRVVPLLVEATTATLAASRVPASLFTLSKPFGAATIIISRTRSKHNFSRSLEPLLCNCCCSYHLDSSLEPRHFTVRVFKSPFCFFFVFFRPSSSSQAMHCFCWSRNAHSQVTDVFVCAFSALSVIWQPVADGLRTSQSRLQKTAMHLVCI